MSDFKETVARQRDQKAAYEAKLKQTLEEDRKRVAGFIALMRENDVDPIAVYRETHHAIQREEGVFRRRLVNTGGIRIAHTLIGHGWPITEAGNDSDYHPRHLTIMDTGTALYQTTYPSNNRYPDTPEVPYVTVVSDTDGPLEVGGWGPMSGATGERKLGYAAIRLINASES